jgi:hypothetical protein
MGIRINIVMGWGLDDVEHDGAHSLIDPRINADSPLINHDSKVTTEDYRAFLAKRGSSIERSYLDPDTWGKAEKTALPSPDDCVIWESEYGEPNVLCIIPVWMYSDWRRRDNSIDYELATHVWNTNPINKVWTLDYGLFPYSASYMDKRVGERIKSDIMTWIRLMGGGKNGKWRVKKPIRKVWDEGGKQTMDECAALGGFADHADAVENCRPYVPDEIKNLCEFGNLFTVPGIVNELRPMIYQYWA